jgi:hypothetical protein
MLADVDFREATVWAAGPLDDLRINVLTAFK